MKKIAKMFKFILPLFIPYIFLMGSVLYIFNPWFLEYEYQKKDFPADSYGFSPNDRMFLATQSIRYIVQNKPDQFLSDLNLENGEPVYQDNELTHMKDVKKVFLNAKYLCMVMLALSGVYLFFAWKTRSEMAAFFKSLQIGSLLSIILVISILVLTLTSFDALFDQFHRLFFHDGSWLFNETDTLIRLFPLKLWVDAFILCGIFDFILSILMYFIGLSSYRKIALRK